VELEDLAVVELEEMILQVQVQLVLMELVVVEVEQEQMLTQYYQEKVVMV
jgi:hypothetical protein